MSTDSDSPTAASPTATTTTSESSSSPSKAHSAIESLSTVLSFIPPPLSSSPSPAASLLHNPDIASQISSLLRQPDSGAGDNSLCRWLYDTFQSTDPNLQLVVLRFLPTIAGVYLSRVAQRKPLAGFEAVLLALYAHETTSRNGQSVTVNVPELSRSSVYHETKASLNNATELNLAVISPTLEPHGTVRSTRRARIVGVTLELYYSKISQMPIDSKIDFCEFCVIWAGQNGDMYKDADDAGGGGGGDEEELEGRIPLPWELLQPVLRILGHCLLGPVKRKEMYEAGIGACRSLYARCLHDMNPKAILATQSLIRLGKMVGLDSIDDFDPTEIPKANVISV